MAEEGPRRRSWIERLARGLGATPESREDLLEILREAEYQGLLDPEDLHMIEGIFKISGTRVRDVMVPRGQMEVVRTDEAPEDFIPRIVEVGFSRLPVVGEDRDDVRGILYAKDLLRYWAAEQRDQFDLLSVIRAPVFVPESKHIDSLLHEFRASRNHMAIVVNEFGGTAGLVTIEDVLEEIVGEIEDEFDIEAVMVEQRGRGRFQVDAQIPLETFAARFGAHLEAEGVDTLGGWMVREMGHLPEVGESLRVDGLLLEVIRADRRRIRSIRVVEQNEAETGTHGGAS
ncbi:MAG: HlyC/CorC family transporter [Thiohalorhabdus sp.]|uniref:HlyC/CorC family transporter n=1 Tax=Thiohalorhabdus sp. TaxID=3094134 RepID=UPI00398112AD